MEIKRDYTGLPDSASSMNAVSSDVLELELYDELMAFSALPTKERELRPEQTSVVENREQINALDDIDLFEQPEVGLAYSDAAAQLAETPFVETAVEQSHELAQAPSAASESAVESLEEPQLEPLVLSEFDNGNNARTVDKADSAPLRFDGLRDSRPLGEIWSAIAIKAAALATCPSCGSQSDTDDLFCIGCGEFLDYSESAANVASVCIECGSMIGNEDIFCPSCGSMVSAG